MPSEPDTVPAWDACEDCQEEAVPFRQDADVHLCDGCYADYCAAEARYRAPETTDEK